jgi:hypothetical protein
MKSTNGNHSTSLLLGLTACLSGSLIACTPSGDDATALEEEVAAYTDVGPELRSVLRSTVTKAGFQPLIIDKTGTGLGTVQVFYDNGGTYECGPDCADVVVNIPDGANVALTATPLDDEAVNHVFHSWSEACTGTDPNQCSFVMDSWRIVRPRFDKAGQLEVVTTGAAGGRVTATLASGASAGIDCGTDCDETYADLVDVTLSAQAVAVPGGFAKLIAWGGDCAGQVGDCLLTIDGTRHDVTAEFGHTLTISPLGTGAARFAVTRPADRGAEYAIDCGNGGADCEGVYRPSDIVTVHAVLPPNVDLQYWGDTCTNPDLVNKTCTVPMSVARTLYPWVMARVSVNVGIDRIGKGTIRVGLEDRSIDCVPSASQPTCTIGGIRHGSRVTFEEFIDSPWTPAGLTGCTPISPSRCELTAVNGGEVIQARSETPYRLNVYRSTPVGTTLRVTIDGEVCPGDCLKSSESSRFYNLGLTARQDNLRCVEFWKWSIAQCGTGSTCRVQVNGPIGVTAFFRRMTTPACTQLRADDEVQLDGSLDEAELSADDAELN